MLHFISTSAYQNACRLLSKRLAEFHRSKQKERSTPAFLESGCFPRPEAIANEVHQCMKYLELKRLDMVIINEAMQNSLRGDAWLNQFRRLFSVLADMERLANGEQV